MCSGKTTYSKQLADKYSLDFIDTDTEIEKNQNCSIPDIFNDKGEAYFRETETKVLKSVVAKVITPTVISTGGGVVLSEENLSHMRNYGSVIFLNTSWEIIYNRLKNINNRFHRPLIYSLSHDNIYKLFLYRLPIYKEVANYIISNKINQQ